MPKSERGHESAAGGGDLREGAELIERASAE
jgi:hypothetical protein